MSPNRVDFDRAIEGLKAESASEEQRRRALISVTKPRRMPRLRLVGLAAASLCIVAGTLLVVPSRGSGLAWGEVVRSTQSAVNIHGQSFYRSGQRFAERWSSGNRYANLFFDPKGRVQIEVRRDERTLYFYLGTKSLVLPNEYHYAQLMGHSSWAPRWPERRNTIDELIAGRGTKVLSHQPVEVAGKPLERYQVSLFGKDPVAVDADPATGRVLRLTRPNGEYDVYDYPDTLDSKIFSWRSRLTVEAPVLDVRSFDPKAPYRIPAPIASKAGVQLRELSINPAGSLYAAWTGERFSRLHRRPFRVLGVRTEKPWYGPGPYLDSQHRKVDELTVVNVALLEKVGDRVSIQIPTGPHSTVEFRNVPVRRLRPLRD